MAMTPLDIDKLAQPVVDVYNKLESDLMVSIARRLRDNGNQVDATTTWQLKKLAEMGGLTKENIKIIASETGTVPVMTEIALEKASYDTINELEPSLREAAEQNLIRTAPEVEVSPAVKNVLTSYTQQAVDKLNLTNTTMLHESEQAYRDIINKTTYAVASGGISRQEALKQTIEEFAEKGLPALTDKAGRKWTPEAYTGMVLKTTVHNTALAAADARMEDYGVDVFEVSTVAGARPLCAPYQGRLYSNSGEGETEDLDGHKIHYGNLQDTSYGKPAGLFGINCHHTKSPWIPGYTKKRYEPTQDEEENARQYKESQQQRAIERDIRKAKRKADMLKTTGLDTTEANAKVKAQQARMRQFISDTGRTRRVDRERVINDGTAQNTLKKEMDSHDATIGVSTSNGITITGLAKHFKQRAVERGFSQPDVQDALTNPLKIGTIKTKENGKSQEFIGDKARVQINPDTGNLITGWKTSKSLRNKLKGS